MPNRITPVGLAHAVLCREHFYIKLGRRILTARYLDLTSTGASHQECVCAGDVVVFLKRSESALAGYTAYVGYITKVNVAEQTANIYEISREHLSHIDIPNQIQRVHENDIMCKLLDYNKYV